jgi:hypothetical protein
MITLRLLVTLRWTNARTLNREGFSCPSLAIREYSSIVALQTTISNRFCNVIKNSFLINTFMPYEIKIKCFSISIITIQLNHSSIIADIDTASFLRVFILPLIKWPDPDDNFYIIGTFTLLA